MAAGSVLDETGFAMNTAMKIVWIVIGARQTGSMPDRRMAVSPRSLPFNTALIYHRV